jgi:phage-related protein
MGPLGTVAGALSAGLAPAVQVLSSPGVAQSLTAIGTALASIILSLSPVVTLFAKGLAGALHGVVPLLQATAKFLQDNHRWTVPLVAVLSGMALAWWAVNAALAANPLVIVGGLIAGLVVGLIYCWEHFKGFRDFVKGMWKEVQSTFFGAWVFIDDIWHKISEGARVGWQLVRSYIFDPIKHAYDDVVLWVGKIFTFVSGIPGELATRGAHAWDWLSSGLSGIATAVGGTFKSIINDALTGVNWAIDQVNGFSHGVSDIWSWIPGASAIGQIGHIPKWKAVGGVAGGLTGMGEAGIEMVRLPNGSVVMPHSNTASALQSGGGGGVQQLQIEWVGGYGGDEFMKWLRSNIRIRGGNGQNSVQSVLGQAY